MPPIADTARPKYSKSMGAPTREQERILRNGSRRLPVT